MSCSIRFARRPSHLFHIVATVLILACWSMAASAQVTLLAADFNDKALDQPIGTGGAVVGEPAQIESTLSAIVRNDVMPGKSLAIDWLNHGTSAGSVRFQWIDGIEVSHGQVTIAFTLTPSAGGGYHAYLRESELSRQGFGTLRFTSSGTVWSDDKAGSILLNGITWSPNESYLVEWVHDLDAATHDLSINGTPYFQGRAHGVDMSGDGLGALVIGISTSSDPASRLDVDDILVTWSGDAVFADDFEGEGFPQ